MIDFFLYRIQKRRKYKREDEPEEESVGGSRLHVRIPQAVAADYDIVPQSIVRADKNKSSKVGIILCLFRV